MMKYNKALRDELLGQAESLKHKAERLQVELSVYPKGYLSSKRKPSGVYYYLVSGDKGSYKYVYIPKNKVADMVDSMAKRERLERRIKTALMQAADFRDIVLRKKYFPKTDIAINYLDEERQRSLRMLSAYRMKEIEALSEFDEDNRIKYRAIAEGIEKSVKELNILLKRKVSETSGLTQKQKNTLADVCVRYSDDYDFSILPLGNECKGQGSTTRTNEENDEDEHSL